MSETANATDSVGATVIKPERSLQEHITAEVKRIVNETLPPDLVGEIRATISAEIAKTATVAPVLDGMKDWMRREIEHWSRGLDIEARKAANP